MTKKQPILSICIPTLNRGPYLKELIESIIKQDEFINTDEIEIVVDDGPSSDDTELIVKDYIKKFGNKIKYYRNPKKIGMCPAFLEAFSYGSGEYCRIFSSDDMMTKDTLRITMELIKRHKPCMIFGREITKGEEKIIDSGDDISILKGMNDLGLYIGNSKNELFKKNTDIFTFISLFCTKKDFFERNLKSLITQGVKLEDIKSNYFNFSLIGFSQVQSDDKIIIIDSPTFVIYTPDNSSRKPNKKIVSDLKILTRFMKENHSLSPKFKKFLNKMEFDWEIRCLYIPYAKKFGVYSILKYIFHKIFG